MNDREMLADLVAAAVNMAIGKAREEVAKASQSMAQDAACRSRPACCRECISSRSQESGIRSQVGFLTPDS